MKYEDLEDFLKCYNPKNRYQRQETERFRSFTFDELIKRDKVNLDIESLEESENLPEPQIIPQEIVENLESALEQFSEIESELTTK